MDEKNLLDKLFKLATLEIDSINGYNSAIPEITEKNISIQMQNFRQDHFDHLQVISMIIREFGAAPPEYSADQIGFYNSDFLNTSSGSGITNALENLLSNEKIINEFYENILTTGFNPENRAQLEGNFDDEQDHAAYIEDILSLRTKAA
jgi:rubrerythrin